MEKMKMMGLVKNLPRGVDSQSGKYFCETCKKLFLLDDPVCPYMTKMCLNAPIPVEINPPSSPEAFEKFGLFYPKIPQRIIDDLLVNVDAKKVGEEFARLYLEEMDAWHIQYKTDLLYFLKFFIVFISGSETAQRILEDEVLFLVMDIDKIYKNSVIKDVLRSGIYYLREQVGFNRKVSIKFVNIIPGEMGRYYCVKCGMFFEFGVVRDKVTCPLMAQKCMFEPKNVKVETGTVKDFIKIYKITPHLYKSFIGIFPQYNGKQSLLNALNLFIKNISESDLNELAEELGINED